MGMIQTDRVDIAFETSGSGQAGVVILIRGQGTQLIHWPESFYEAFSTRGFRTIRFDNRDTGLSGKFDRHCRPGTRSTEAADCSRRADRSALYHG